MGKKSIALVVLLALAILMGVLWFGMQLGKHGAEQATAGIQMPGGGRNIPPALPAVTAPPLQFNQTAPPWATAGGANAAPGTLGSAAQIERQKQLGELKTMQMALMKSMQENHQADPNQVIALLDKIKQVTGSSTVGGVNLDDLRSNLTKAVEIQRVAADMNREATKPGGADPKKIKAYADQLQSLQRQIVVPLAPQPKPSPGSTK